MGIIIDLNQAARQGEVEKPPDNLDADIVRVRVQARMEEFLHWLYGNRVVIKRGNARIGNPDGDKGGSCSIELVGDNAGVWTDFANRSSGNLFDLYAIYMGLNRNRDFDRILREISRDFLQDKIEVPRNWNEPTPGEKIAAKLAKYGNEPCPTTVELGPANMSWHYYDADNRIIATMRRYELEEIDQETGKPKKTYRPFYGGRIGAPSIRPLYRIPNIIGANDIVLVEGEKCADALVSIGFEATTVMMGANSPLDRVDWTPLKGKRVTIWPDNDEAGFGYARGAAAILAQMGCAVRMVDVPEGARAKWDAADMLEDGGDPAQLIGSARPWEGPTAANVVRPVSPFRLWDIDELDAMPPPRWLIDGLIPEEGFSVLYGRPGARKSFVALDMALCIAAGISWHGRTIKEGNVIYLAAEGRSGMRTRIAAWRKSRIEAKKPKLRLILQSANLIVQVNELIACIKASGENVDFFVIDTLARVFGNGDENSTKDMVAFVAAIDKLREELGCHVLIVHHSGKDETKGSRGSIALLGGCDAEFEVRKDGDDGVIVRNTKQKDADESKPINLRAARVEVEIAGETHVSNVLVMDDVSEDEENSSSVFGNIRHGKTKDAIIKALSEIDDSVSGMTLRAISSSVNKDKSNVRRALLSLIEVGTVVEIGDESTLTKLYNLSANFNRE